MVLSDSEVIQSQLIPTSQRELLTQKTTEVRTLETVARRGRAFEMNHGGQVDSEGNPESRGGGQLLRG